MRSLIKRYRQSINPPYKRKDILTFLITFLIFPLCFLLGIVLIIGYSNTNKIAFAENNKHLLLISKRHFKSVCDIPKAHSAKCFAKVITDDSLNPLAASSPSTSSMTPLQFHMAYSLPCTPGGPVQAQCGGVSTFCPTIAIVDAYNTPTIENDLNTYSSYFGLPSCTQANGCLQIVNQNGGTNLPTAIDQGWSLEASLDVQTVHAICQTCKILLVETNSNSLNDLATGVGTAASMNVYAISNSYGAAEWSSETSYDPFYTHTSTAVVASSGDNGYGTAYPAANPNVVAVGGTTLQLYSDNTYASESVWSGAGSGCSSYETGLGAQQSLANWGSTGCGSRRGVTDISADADPNTGAAVFDSTPYSSQTGWWQVGGTSLAAPLVAASFALSPRVTTTSTGTSVLYTNNTLANFHDVTAGSNGSCSTIMCSASIGYDGPSGIGSLNGIGGFGGTIASASPSVTPASTSTPAPAPAAPTNLIAAAISSSQIHLQWDAVQDSVGIGVYNVYRNGLLIVQGNILNYTNNNLTPNTTYTYTVQAQDIYGNKSPLSNPATATTFPAVTATPTATMTPSPQPSNTPTPTTRPTLTPTSTPAPTPPAAPQVAVASCIAGPVTGTSNLTLSWSDPHVNWVNIGMDSNNSTYYDKGVSGLTSTQAPAGFSGASSNVSGQSLVVNPNTTYYASVWDGINNLLSSSTAFSVPSCPPAVSITNPSNGATVPHNSKIVISATATDYVSIKQVQFWVDNSLKCTDTTNPYTCNWSVGAKKNVSYTLKTVASDTLGNSGSTSITVTAK